MIIFLDWPDIYATVFAFACMSTLDVMMETLAMNVLQFIIFRESSIQIFTNNSIKNRKGRYMQCFNEG